MKKLMIVVIMLAVLLMGCGKEEEPEKFFKYYAEGVEDEIDLRENYFPLYEDEYIAEFGENGYVITYKFDGPTHRAKWVAIEREDDWYDDVQR